MYKKSGYPHSLKLEEIKAGTKLKVVAGHTVTQVSLFSITDSLLIGSRDNSNTAFKIEVRDIEEIWIRSYHDSTSRKGFFIGFNLGASKSSRNFSNGSDETLRTGFIGIGGTYFLKKTAPTFYGNIFCGVGLSGGGAYINNSSPSFGVGLGYQFNAVASSRRFYHIPLYCSFSPD